jgi:hypothetical protein
LRVGAPTLRLRFDGKADQGKGSTMGQFQNWHGFLIPLKDVRAVTCAATN